MNGLTIGQTLGIYPLYSELPIRHQFKSKNDGQWKDCHKSELNKYEKYIYETRILFS